MTNVQSSGLDINIMWHVPESVFQSLAMAYPAKDRQIWFCVDYQNVASYMYSLIDCKWYRGNGIIPVINYGDKSDDKGQKGIIMLDAKQMAGVLVTNAVRFIYDIMRKAQKYDLDVRVIFFAEIGKSRYHLSYMGDYKKTRWVSWTKIDDPILIYNAHLVGIANRLAILIMNQIFDLLPKTTFILLDQWESDFVPYYLSLKTINMPISVVTLSNDSDMLQNLLVPGSWLVRRIQKKVSGKMKPHMQILHGKEDLAEIAFKHVKNIDLEHKIQVAHLYTVFKSIMGDDSDNIVGIPGMGPVKSFKLCQQLADKGLTYPDTMDEETLSKMLAETNKKFTPGDIATIIRNMHLIDYRYIIQELDESVKETIDYKLSLLDYSHKDFITIADTLQKIPAFEGLWFVRMIHEWSSDA